jgi:hypothetical protein
MGFGAGGNVDIKRVGDYVFTVTTPASGCNRLTPAYSCTPSGLTA